MSEKKRTLSDYFTAFKKLKPGEQTASDSAETICETASSDPGPSKIDETLEESDESFENLQSTDSESLSEADSETEDCEAKFESWIKSRQNPELKLSSRSHVPGPLDLSQTKVDEPKQPVLQFYPKTKFLNKFRQFNKAWYNTFPWVEYSVSADSVYCFACRHFSPHASDQNSNVAFISVGFKNWKKAMDQTSGLKLHNSSSDHKSCMIKWSSFKQIKASGEGSVAGQLSEAHLNLVKENRLYVSIVVDVILYTAMQCIAQRGSKENSASSNRGNFLELLSLFAKYNDVVKKKLNEEGHKNSKYTSPKIQNEILFIISRMTLEKISTEINKASCFAVICDETKDISKTEQVSVVLRYYLDGTVYERFIGFHAAQDLNANSLFSYIKNLLQRCSVDIKRCVAQTYDGANVMSGRVGGVQKLFTDEVEQAIYVHCYSHRLNLVVVDICRNLTTANLFFGLIENLYVFVSGSAIHAQFINIQKELRPNKKPIELKKICYTRWTAQVFACLSLKKVFSELLILLNKLSVSKSARSAEALGLLHQLDYTFIFNLCMYSQLLSIFKNASDYLQKVTSNLSEANILITSIYDTIMKMRTDDKNETFMEIFSETEKICADNNIPIEATARRRKMPKKYMSYLVTEELNNLERSEIFNREDYLHKIFYPVLDLITNELQNRFEKNSPIVNACDALHPENPSFLNYDKLLPMAQHYHSELEILQAKLKIIPNTIKQYQIKTKVNIKNIMDFIDMLQKYDLVFPELLKLGVIGVTIPVSSAACERTFSCLRRLKTYLRNKMSDERLVHLAIINIERETAKSLDTSKIVDEFDAAHKNRRIILH